MDYIYASRGSNYSSPKCNVGFWVHQMSERKSALLKILMDLQRGCHVYTLKNTYCHSHYAYNVWGVLLNYDYGFT
jgi:hypothetical protein